MRAYREWLPAASMEGMHSVGGSLADGNIEDHYRIPHELGYGFMIKFDHDFIGRASLEAMAERQKRKKVRLVWNDEDVVDILSSAFGKNEAFKKIEIPMANYATAMCDRVQSDGVDVGVSYYPVYSEADRSLISLGAVPEDLAIDGHELTLIWGEPDGGSDKLTVEPHVQKTVRVKVDTQPIKRD